MRVWVVNGYGQYYDLFKGRGWEVYNSSQEMLDGNIDLVCFTGGEDVSPSLYMKHPHRLTQSSSNRDLQEIGIYLWAKRNGIPCVGICRGGQFLNVMNGGEMIQHIDDVRHCSGPHMIVSYVDNYPHPLMATSTHHQMMVPNYSGTLLAVDSRNNEDVEVIHYEETKDLCFQPHPEFGSHELKDYFFGLIEEYLM